MEKIILSLKNIYMLLMTEDFPIYSQAVIGRNDRRGLTMLRFWQSQLAEEFRCLSCGRMLWRSDGKRNRYTSYLCNRSAEIKTYTDYARELSSQISTASLFRQTEGFMEFLSGRNYRHDTLLRRVRELTRRTEAEDPRVCPAIADQLYRTADWQPGSIRGCLFQAAHLLTLLTLYAAAGEAMDDPMMAVLRAREFDISELWSLYNQPREAETTMFLTAYSGLLQGNPLPPHRFFGREEELFNLKEIAASGRKCLISGMGGIGKTELLRQLIRVCESERIVDRIAVVPYVGSIVESVARSFPESGSRDPEDRFHGALYRLEAESRQGKVLLLIDNLTCGTGEDPELEALLRLPCGILITSRREALPGFEVCRLAPPTVATGCLIFRDNFGRPLNREDRAALGELLAEETICHPLTLRLMARAARSKGWTVTELKDRLAHQKAPLSWQEADGTVRLSQVYRQLYSFLRIPEECQLLAELFTLLPRDSYRPDFLREWFPPAAEGDMGEKLAVLAEGGWLDRDSSGYSMHPLIAQCLRRRVITEQQVSRLTGKLCGYLAGCRPKTCGTGAESHQQLAGIFTFLSSFLTGTVSRDWLAALAAAYLSLDALPQVRETGIRALDSMEKRCPQRDDAADLLCLMARCNWLCADADLLDQVYQRQKEARSIPDPLFYDFCCMAGYAAAYQFQNFSLAEALLREALSGQQEPRLKAEAYCTLIDTLSWAGKRKELVPLCEEGAAYGREHPDVGSTELCGLLSRQCQAYVLMGQWDKADGLFPDLKAMLTETEDPHCRYYLLIALNYYSDLKGDYDAALEYARMQSETLLRIRGKRQEYYSIGIDIAEGYRQMKRYDEAIPYYEESAAYFREAGDPYWSWNSTAHYSMLRMDMGQPETALEYLNAVERAARNTGGYVLGEQLRYQAKAWGMLEDRERETACLLEALPLLETAYGADHSHTTAVRQRLEEISREPSALG